jgi:hypothetical protein
MLREKLPLLMPEEEEEEEEEEELGGSSLSSPLPPPPSPPPPPPLSSFGSHPSRIILCVAQARPGRPMHGPATGRNPEEDLVVYDVILFF